MSNSSCDCRALVALLVITAGPIAMAQAEEYVNEQYGFRFQIPPGFYEQTANLPMTLKMFTEDEQSTEGYLIVIYIQHLGQIIDPAQRLDPAQIPKKEGLKLTPEIRRWQDLELQAVRQDFSLEPDIQFVGYLIQFPLHDEGIQIRVQGPKSREKEVLNVFNQSVESFVNLKPYIVSVQQIKPGRTIIAFIAESLFVILPVCVLLFLLSCFVILIRRSKTNS